MFSSHQSILFSYSWLMRMMATSSTVFIFSGWSHIRSNCHFVVWQADILQSIFNYAHIGMITMQHFLQFSDSIHLQVSTNMPIGLLGLLICVSHEMQLNELQFHLWKWKSASNFVIALALNLECGVISLVGQVVLYSEGDHLECRIVLISRLFLKCLPVAVFSSSSLFRISVGSSMSGRLTIQFEQLIPGGSFSHFCALQCEARICYPFNGHLVIACIICGSIILETCI